MKIYFCAALTKVVKEFDSRSDKLPGQSCRGTPRHPAWRLGEHQGVQTEERPEETLDRTLPGITGYPRNCQMRR